MGDPSLRPLRLIDADEDARRFDAVVATMAGRAGVPTPQSQIPCCHRLSLAVVETRPYPEFGAEGIEQHEVRCTFGYQGSRLYEPRDFLR